MLFLQELFVNVYGESLKLIEENNDETGVIKNISIDVDQYKAAEKTGYVRVYTARVDDKLVGYCMMLISKHPHYSNTLCATQDTLYMAPEYRGVQSVKFIKWCDAQLEAEGIDYVFRQVTKKVDFSRTLESMSYVPVETNYMRKLQGCLN
jgi:hypothetical protein